MFHSRNMESRINRIHEGILILVYENSQDLSFSESLLKDKSFTIHQASLQILPTEIHKAKQGISTEVI